MRLSDLLPIDGSPLVIAHRGAPAAALENTLASFAAAIRDGVSMIEFDIRISKDGVPFVVHDGRIGRICQTANFKLSSTESARLSAVRLRNGEPLPTLAAVLDLVRGACALNIEAKSKGAVAAAVATLSTTGYVGPVLFSSPLHDECLAALALRPDLPCGLVVRRPSASDVAFCRACGMSIHPDHRLLTVMRLRALRTSGVPFLPYTVNDPARCRALVAAGAAGVFSDRASDLARELASVPGRA